MSTNIKDSKDIVECFKAAVQVHGHRPAMEYGERTWSYQELDRLSDRLACQLRSSEVHPKCVLVIDCGRSPFLVLAALASVKARMVFFVTGENQPETYVARVLERLNNIVWLSAEGYSDKEKAKRIAGDRLNACYIVGEHDLTDLGDTNGQRSVKPDQRSEMSGVGEDYGMYLVATSGTTGRPKLVFTGATPILNFIEWYRSTFSLTHQDKFSMLSGLGYDPLIRDIFAPLSLGACVSIPTKAVLGNRHGLRNWIDERRVSVIHATPPLAQVIFDKEEKQRFDGVRIVAIGGSGLTRGLAGHIRTQLTQGLLVNVYGTSETPQVMTYHVVEEGYGDRLSEATHDIVPLGKPISQVAVRILNDDGEALGESEVGEIHIVTPHLANGYFEDPQMTRDKFTYCEKHRCSSYRTGDLGYLDSDGDLHFVGRKDREVKYRGYRIQLEEIERTIQQLDEVLAAAVVYEGSQGAEKLICYVQRKWDVEFSASDIKRKLVAVLPAYMTPDNYICVDKMPLNSGNKIDYAALTKILPIMDSKDKSQVVSLVNDSRVAKELLSIWAKVLGISTADIAFDNSFFDVGGNSLLSVQLIDYINKAFSKTLTTTDLFVYSNISDLSKYIACEGNSYERMDNALNVGRRADRLSRMSIERNRRVREEI